jgi:hypothetical protein
MKRLLYSATVIAAGLFAGLGIAEVLVRLFAPHSRDHVVPAGMFAIDSELGWRLKPGAVARHRTRYFDAEYRVNSLGFRDRAREPARRDSVVRVLVFGDSQVFGWGVNVDQRFSSVLESRMQSVEAWNMAVPGYGFDQQVLSYERSGDDIPADAAVFYASSATLSRMKFGFIFGKPKPRFVLDSTGTLVLVPLEHSSAALTDGVYRLLSRFYLPYFLEAQLIRLVARDGRVTAVMERNSGEDPAGLSLLEAILVRARAVAAQRGHRLIVLASLSDETIARLQPFCDSNGITLVSTGWSAGPDDLVFGKYDRHWIPKAHTLVASRLMQVLGDRFINAVPIDPPDDS